MNTRNIVTLFVVCALLAGGSTVLAQGGRPGGRGGGGRGGPPALPDSTQVVQIVEKLSRELSLTEDQEAQVAELHFAHFDEVRAQMADRSGDRESHRTKMEAMREEFTNEVKALLDDEQKEKYDEIRQERGMRSDRGGQRRK